MGEPIARLNDEISGFASGHIDIRRWNSSVNGGWYSYSTTGATINGRISEANARNVYANGILVAVKNNQTTESDSYTIPSGWSYDGGSHSNVNGSVSNGSSSVFINGIPVARKGDSVATHAGVTGTITNGSGNVFVGD